MSAPSADTGGGMLGCGGGTDSEGWEVVQGVANLHHIGSGSC